MKPSENARIRVPDSVVAELEAVEQRDNWGEGVPLDLLIDLINDVVARFTPQDTSDSTRSKLEFTPRSFRHYQTLGCIDSPRRSGRTVVYQFRHYLQGLLVRKLLWERVSSEQMVTLMTGQSNESLKRLLFDGIEFVARGEGTDGRGKANQGPQSWTRIEMAPGIEIQLREGRPQLDASEIESLKAAFEDILRRS